MTCKPEKWIGLGFVATAVNASPDVIKSMGPIATVAPQVCWGMGHPASDPGLTATRQMLDRCRAIGLGVAGWAWCQYPDQAENEAEYHAMTALELGLDKFIANMEEPYDAHGNSSDPRMWAPDRYADCFRAHAPNVELGLTTTPRWGSSGNEMRAVGATIMPQAFTGEVPSATVPACVEHAQAWGWTLDRIRPLVQVYQPRPSATTYNEDSQRCGVGTVPYVLEQAFDGEGMDMVRTLAPSITRAPASSSQPQPEPPSNAPDLPFKRALYPPDAEKQGKKPSVPGKDVEAVKRAISRAGFWRWQSFDQTYSNGFSHGRNGDGPGVEGFQGKYVDLKGKPPSGWYGSATHEALRCFVLPSGPHKGEWAFDATAINLYRSA